MQEQTEEVIEKPRKHILKGIKQIHEYLVEKYSIHFNQMNQRKRLITIYGFPVVYAGVIILSSQEDIDDWIQALVNKEILADIIDFTRPTIKNRPRNLESIRRDSEKKANKIRKKITKVQLYRKLKKEKTRVADRDREIKKIIFSVDRIYDFQDPEARELFIKTIRKCKKLKIKSNDVSFIIRCIMRASFKECGKKITHNGFVKLLKDIEKTEE
ncbi:MAG: hypothetical protein WC055_00520 [Melioribacteraceae bacterium]